MQARAALGRSACPFSGCLYRIKVRTISILPIFGRLLTPHLILANGFQLDCPASGPASGVDFTHLFVLLPVSLP